MRVVMLASFVCLTACSMLVEDVTRLPGLSIRYTGGHARQDVAIAVVAWMAALEASTGESADVDGVSMEERTLSEDLDGYISRSGNIVIAHKSHVSSMAIMHELTHVHLERTYGDGDPDHDGGTGPWTRRHQEAIQAATEVVRKCGL